MSERFTAEQFREMAEKIGIDPQNNGSFEAPNYTDRDTAAAMLRFAADHLASNTAANRRTTPEDEGLRAYVQTALDINQRIVNTEGATSDEGTAYALGAASLAREVLKRLDDLLARQKGETP